MKRDNIMEDKRIKMFLMILAIITVFQSVSGFVTLFTGLYAKEFDKKKADEMLTIIKQTDKNYYDKIFSPDDKTYMEDFKRNYTKNGNQTALFMGFTMIFFSILYAAPLIMLSIKKEDKKISDELSEGLPEEAKEK